MSAEEVDHRAEALGFLMAAADALTSPTDHAHWQACAQVHALLAIADAIAEPRTTTSTITIQAGAALTSSEVADAIRQHLHNHPGTPS